MSRRGFVLSMWTGLFENPRTGKPILFGSVQAARRYLSRFPAWGRSAVEVRKCTVRPGANGNPDYILERAIAA